MTIKELEQLEFENKFFDDIPLLDELYILISNDIHESGYLMYKIYGIAYDKNKEITYAKCLSNCSDIIHIAPAFIRRNSVYALPLLSIDSKEPNMFRIFTRSIKGKIKINCIFSDFEFEIVEEEE